MTCAADDEEVGSRRWAGTMSLHQDEQVQESTLMLMLIDEVQDTAI